MFYSDLTFQIDDLNFLLSFTPINWGGNLFSYSILSQQFN